MKKKVIIEHFEYMTEDQINLIYDIIQLSNHSNKRDLVKFSGKNAINFDTAYPSPYMDRIQEIYPKVREGMFIFDYTTSKFGELVNINNWIVNRILTDINKF